MTVEIIQGDCLVELPKLKAESIDCVVTDPPYNLGLADWDEKGESNPFFTMAWLKQCERLLKPASYLWVTAGCVKASEIELAVRELDRLRLKNCVIWYRKDGWKGDSGFAKSHEHILLFCKDKINAKEHRAFMDYLNSERHKKGLNLNSIKELFGYATSGGGNASNWMGDKEQNTLPTKPDYQKLKGLLGLDNRFDSLPFPKPIKIRKTDAWDDVWIDIRSERNRVGHPTQKPEKLIMRMVESTSDEGDTVLDPFLGSGTTAIVCTQLMRNCIGIEISPEYCQMARDRKRGWVGQVRLATHTLP